MDIYHSFCHYEFNSDKLEKIKKLHELSVKCALHSYGNIHLITTLEGREFLGDLPYTSIEIFDEKIENLELTTSKLINRYPHLWALGKMIACHQIAKKKKPFFHIDYDLFMFKRLPEEYHSADLVLQNIENSNILNKFYELDQFEEYIGQKFFYNPTKKCAYNCGIFGGNNFEIMISYFQEAMKLLLDPENDYFWSNYEKIMHNKYKKKFKKHGYKLDVFNPLASVDEFLKNLWTAAQLGSCVLEQFWLYQFCEYKNFKPLLIFENKDYVDWGVFFHQIKERSNQLGFFHLMGTDLKFNEEIVSIIEQRVKQLN